MNKQKNNVLRSSIQLALAGSLLVGTSSYADLKAHGPLGPHGYPTWYQDQSGLAVELCTVDSQAELDGGWCLLLPGDTTAPESFPNQFFDEHFYWNAGAVESIPDPNGSPNPIKLSVVLALEAAFAIGPVVQGDQMVFGRVRFKMLSVPYDGLYKFYTPYGYFEQEGIAGETIFFTQDIGLTPGNFDQVLASSISPNFLLPSGIPGGAEVPPIPDLTAGIDPFYDSLGGVGGATAYPDNGKKYVADPGRIGPLTGATCDAVTDTHCEIDLLTAKPAWKTGNIDEIPNVQSIGHTNPNIFRVEGPNGFAHEIQNFGVMGRLYEGAVNGKLVVDRASYTANTGTNYDLSVFASATSASQSRLPTRPVPPEQPPQLTMYPAPCSLDANNIPGAPAGVAGYQMISQIGNDHQFRKEANLPGVRPTHVCMQHLGVNAGGQIVQQYSEHPTTDQIHITEALFDPVANALSVSALSSDTTQTVELTVDGYGKILLPINNTVVGTLNVPTHTPPEHVSVRSTAGGLAELQVDTGTLVGAPPLPVANNDSFPLAGGAAILEDGGAVDLAVLGNDTNVNQASGITVSSVPASGTALPATDANGNLVIRYTPRLNFNGQDAFTYQVSVGTVVSNTASVIVNVTPVNDLPVAVNDPSPTTPTGAVINIPVALNITANDTDVDGNNTIVGGVITAGNTNLKKSDGTSLSIGDQFTGKLTVTAIAAGTQSFSYKAIDSSGGVSTNAANVAMSVSLTDQPVITRSQYTSKSFRWVVDGTVAASAGQTIKLTYIDGIKRATDGSCPNAINVAGMTVGTATVDAANNWVFDRILSPTTGVLNPTNTNNSTPNGSFWCTPPRNIRATSSLTGATANNAIATK